MNLCNLNDIRALLGRHGFHFSKAMGQNFLIDAAVPQAIAGSGADESCGVLEIGPGIGCLTEQLARRAGKVVSVELDKRLLPVLAETMAPYENVSIISGDILKLDIAALVEQEFSGRKPIVCANLPYNIRHDPERSCPADLRSPQHRRLRRLFGLYAVLHRTAHPV